MTILITAILDAGRSAVDIAIFTFLPLMIVTFSLMRYVEDMSALQWLAVRANPICKAFGLDGLGALAVMQLSLVSSAAPIAALLLMARKNVSDRFLTAAFAGVLAAAPANASLPLATIGIDPALIILNGVCGALVASTFAYWIVGRRFPSPTSIGTGDDDVDNYGEGRLDLLSAINRGGADAIKVISAVLPVLVIALALVKLIQSAGAISALTSMGGRSLQMLGLSQQDVLLFATKCLAGSSAAVALLFDLRKEFPLQDKQIMDSSALLVNALDLPGLSMLIASVPRLRSVAAAAVVSALVGIAVRMAILLCF